MLKSPVMLHVPAMSHARDVARSRDVRTLPRCCCRLLPRRFRCCVTLRPLLPYGFPLLFLFLFPLVSEFASLWCACAGPTQCTWAALAPLPPSRVHSWCWGTQLPYYCHVRLTHKHYSYRTSPANHSIMQYARACISCCNWNHCSRYFLQQRTHNGSQVGIPQCEVSKCGPNALSLFAKWPNMVT